MNQRVNAPDLRFPGFDGEWEEKELGDLYSFAGSGGTPTATNTAFYGGPIPFLGIADINRRVIESTAKTITQRGLDNSTSWLVPAGAVSLAMYASVGKVGILSADTATSQAFYNMVFEDIGARNFVFSALERALNEDAWEPYISTGTQRNLNAEKVKGFSIKAPSLPEQQKIGDLFENLDSLIHLQQKELKKLRQIKTAMLGKMFPRPGATVPEIRFPGFHGEWVEKALGSLGETYSGLSGKSKNDFGHGDAEFVIYTNIYSNAVADLSGVESVEIDSRQNEVRFGDVLFTTSSEVPEEVGMSSVWLDDRPNVYLNSFCFGWRPKTKCDPFFTASVLRSPLIRKQFILLAQGISRYNISKTKAMDILVPFPSLPEQQKIGEFFENLDSLIDLEVKKGEKLSQIKSSLLSKMFV